MASKKNTATDDIMKDALERFEDSHEGSEHNRDAYYEDFQFAKLEDQWPDAILKQRRQEGRPALVINKLPALIRTVVNESRQNKPSIKVSPVDNGADEDTAEVISGLIRSIERNSNAEVAYDTAIDQAVTGGMGFFRISIDYAHTDTFDLEARIDRVPNAMQVHYDTNSTKFDASDWEYGFISDMMTRRDYKAKYPEGSEVQFDGDSRNDASDQWINEDLIRVAEYFKRDMRTRNIVQLEIPNQQTGQMDLQVVREDQLPIMAKALFEAGGIDVEGMSEEDMVRGFMEMSGVNERRRREVEYFEVTRRIINGVEVLEQDKWPGSTIPICPVWGDETFLDGRRYFRSMIRSAKDSQMMFNFWRSASTELVALAPKAPWLLEEGAIPKGQETKWANANTRSHSYLTYNKGSNLPQRQAFAGVPAGVLQESLNANDDMKAITGIFDSSIGAQSNETSGKAILARERQGDVSNFHFVDNLSRAIRYCGQVLVEIIPAVYSASETVRILGEDEAQNVIKLTQEAGGSNEEGLTGHKQLYNLSVGKYDVTVSSGPNFATQREETRETLIEIMRQVPDAAPFIGDALLDHMDFQGADKIAKRLKHMLPQEIRDMESEDVTEADNPEAAAAQQELKAFKMQTEQMQKQVMDEIQKIQAENEALKADKSSEQQKIAIEGQAKMKELQLKEQELALKASEPTVTPEQQWEYDRQDKLQEQAFQAEQNALDRQTDLAKTIIGKAESGDDEETMEDAATVALREAAAILGADREIVLNEFGEPVGSRIVPVEVEVEVEGAVQ
jgi:hypothetical protein